MLLRRSSAKRLSSAPCVTACLLAAAALGGCAGAGADAASVGPKAAPRAQAASDGTKAAAPGHLLRREVEDALSQGPPWLLRRVVVEEVLRDGKFVGWRVLSVPEEWSKLNLKAGDVVTLANGKVIERPDDLWAVWTALWTAKELRIAYQRDGSTKELVLPIDGEPSPQALAASQGEPPNARPRAPAGVRPRGVVVIEEDTSAGDEEPAN